MARRWLAIAGAASVATVVAVIAALSLGIVMFFAGFALSASRVSDALTWLAMVGIAATTFVVAFREMHEKLTRPPF